MHCASSGLAGSRSGPAADRTNVQAGARNPRWDLPSLMRIRVEPENGHDLDRLITALLNATGIVHRTIQATDHRASDGTQIMDRVAERLRLSLTLLAELRGDDELALATQVLAEATLLAAEDIGLEGAFYEP